MQRSLLICLLGCAALTACGDDGGPTAPAAVDSGSGGHVGPPVDGGAPDAETTPDASSADAATDAAPPATDGAPDASATATDAGDAAPQPPAIITDDSGDILPERLAQTGLYQPGSVDELGEGVLEFTPRYALWSDTADKRRFLWLPPGEAIDTSDMNAWAFPVGTRVWKEFSRDGKKLETRLLWKTEAGWYMMPFVWNDAENEALPNPDGVPNARGTEHDIPERADCDTCHPAIPDRLLGVSAIQLSHDGPGATFLSLAAAGALSSVETTATGDHRLPATPDWDALGYVHANCGNCHQPGANGWERVEMDLWLRVESIDSVENTTIYRATVGVPLTQGLDLDVRIAAGQPDQSGVLARMQLRGDDLAMPPIASELVDDAGVALVRAFIAEL